jgi:hypothetical protein
MTAAIRGRRFNPTLLGSAAHDWFLAGAGSKFGDSVNRR